MRRLNIAGQRFGRLLAIEDVGIHIARSGQTKRPWRCLCDCGGESITSLGNLRCGATTSCGCRQRQVRLDRISANTTHGECVGGKPSAEMSTWGAMKQRCSDPKRRDFANYGGRGIRVCDEWAQSFEAFLGDMGRRPSGRHSIDRIDNDGDYEPGNCRWATRQEQGRNTRATRKIVIDEESHCLTDWLRIYGRHVATFRGRMRRGWSVIAAITTPAVPRDRRWLFAERFMTHAS